jgi:hypothetical protein
MMAPNTSSTLITVCRLGVLALALCGLGSTALAQRLQLESAVVDSASGSTLSITKNDGVAAAFFDLQKKIVYDTLRGIGISVDGLPPDVRTNLARFHTQNLEAFRAFSSGLNALDDGKFAQAKAFFERAIELDPGFALARDMQVAMPQTNLTSGLQLQAVLREAAKNAAEAGKTSVEIDASRAVAALLAGQSVVVTTRADIDAATSANASSSGPDFTANPPGSADQFGTRTVVGISYTVNSTEANVGIASSNEWAANQVRTSGGTLEAVGYANGFTANRVGASDCCNANHTLANGTVVHWGTWNSAPGASATVTVSGQSISAPQLGAQTTYMFAPATVTMPSTGTATYVPAAGPMEAISGTITTNFVTRGVQVNDLGFRLSGLTFSGLNGTAIYSQNIASGFFIGNYTSGQCIGCVAFAPEASAFGGNFVGNEANGLLFTSILQTGKGTVSGLHLFKK